MKLSIVIVSYNVRRYLDQCLESVQKAVEGIDGTEVFVVDNASPDDTLTVLPDKYPWVHFIANEENLGFTYAQLDKYIRTGKIDDMITKKKIDDLHQKNMFKLKPVPCFDPEEEAIYECQI